MKWINSSDANITSNTSNASNEGNASSASNDRSASNTSEPSNTSKSSAAVSRAKNTVQYPNETFLFFVYYLPQAEGKVIETEYPFGRQMGTICLLGELFIQHAQLWGMPSVIIHIFGGFSHSSNLTLWEAPSELLTDWGLFPSYTKKIWFLLLPCFVSSKNHWLTDSILHSWYWQHQDDGAHRGGGQH